MTGPDILIADIHLFGKICRGGKFRDTMNDIRKKKPHCVIIDGDLYHKKPRIDAHYFEKMMKEHPKQAAGIRTMQAMEHEDGVPMITIPGNHDPNLALIKMHHPRFVFGHVVDEYTWERNGVLYYVTHGHQGDPSMSHPFGDFFADVHNLIQRLDREDPHTSRKIEKMFTRKIQKERLVSTPRWVMARAKELGAGHAFWAHTHEAVAQLEEDGIVGHGIGSFCDHPASYFEVTDHGPKLHVVD